MKVTFSRQELAAALLFASQDESRYILTGVCLKYRDERQPLAVTTDGRRLTVIESLAEQEVDADGAEAGERDIIIRGDIIKPIIALNKAVGGKLFPWITIANKRGSERVQFSMLGGKFWIESEQGALAEGNYPNWQGVIPPKNQKREPLSEVGLNSEFIGDYAKAVKVLEADSTLIQMNLVGKEQQIEVKIPAVPNFYGLVMQCRLQDGVDYQPEFLGIVESLPKQEGEPVEA